MVVRIKKYGAEWCPPCKQMQKELKSVRDCHKDWCVDEYDESKHKKEFAVAGDVRAYPTTVFEVGSRKKKVEGYMSKSQIERVVKALEKA